MGAICSSCRFDDLKDLDELSRAGDLFSMPELEDVKLPAGGRLTVMLFGMTGSGKSALGNLLAGYNHFASGDDTASVTDLRSVKSWKAHDDSLVVLDSIGLGDTEIDEDKVVNSIRDVALSAPNGIDAMFFVMRFGRITDDTIARLIYVTEFLWGTECLMNLYIVVTFAGRYMSSRDEANAWIARQVEINWRFKHILNMVDGNPNRFIFIDNPDPQSREPFLRQRRAKSRYQILKTLSSHPRAVIAPFTHVMMKRAQQRTEEALLAVQQKETEIQQLEEELKVSRPQPKPAPEIDSGRADFFEDEVVPLQEDVLADTETVIPERLRKALEEKEEAERKLQEVLNTVHDDSVFQTEALQEVLDATGMFAAKYENAVDEPTSSEQQSTAATLSPYGSEASKPNASYGNPIQACKRILSRLQKFGGKGQASQQLSGIAAKRSSNDHFAKISGAQPSESRLSPEEVQQRIESLRAKLTTHCVALGPTDALFKKIAPEAHESIPPFQFSEFVTSALGSLSPVEITGLWRKADTNCDGMVDLKEFTSLLSSSKRPALIYHK